MRTTAGRDFTSDAMLKSSARPTVANILALSESATAPDAGHTVLAGVAGNELAVDGFARAVANYGHVAGTQTSTLQYTFTHSGPAGGGTAHTIRLVGVFAQASGGAVPGAADSGILVFELAEPNPPTLTGTDSLNQTVSIDWGA